MADRALIFDLDGTLIDTVRQHAEAFSAAFAERGIHIPADRIAQEIGKGGDRVVPAVGGEQANAAFGEEVRERHGGLYRQRVSREGARVFDGARELLEELRRRGIATALATASKADDLNTVLEAARFPAKKLVDQVVCDADVEESKPAPDAVRAAVEKLGLSAAQCAMVGDTVWDLITARRAGVVAFGVCTGPHDAEQLRAAGARAVYPDVAALLRDLDHVLALAFPGAPLDTAKLERWMGEALAEADHNLRHDRLPVGAVLCSSDGTVLARARHEVADRGCTAHAAIRALDGYAGDLRDAVLVTTLEPCAMCWGAAVTAGIDAVVYAHEAAGSGPERCAPAAGLHHPRAVPGIRRDDARAQLDRYATAHGRRWDEVSSAG